MRKRKASSCSHAAEQLKHKKQGSHVSGDTPCTCHQPKFAEVPKQNARQEKDSYGVLLTSYEDISYEMEIEKYGRWVPEDCFGGREVRQMDQREYISIMNVQPQHSMLPEGACSQLRGCASAAKLSIQKIVFFWPCSSTKTAVNELLRAWLHVCNRTISQQCSQDSKQQEDRMPLAFQQ